MCVFLVKNDFRTAIDTLLKNIDPQENEVVFDLLRAIEFLFERISPQTHLASFQDTMGNTILYHLFALLTNNDQDGLRRHVLEILVEAGCDPYCKNNFGQSFFDLIQNLGTESEKYFFKIDLKKRLITQNQSLYHTTEEENGVCQSQTQEMQDTLEADYNTVIVERENPLCKNKEEEQNLAVDEKKKIENLIKKNMPTLPQAPFTSDSTKHKNFFRFKKSREHKEKEEVLGEIAVWFVPPKFPKKKWRCILS